MEWEPALPPAKCFEGVCLCLVELHRDLRPQAAGAHYLPSFYGFGIGRVKQDLTCDQYLDLPASTQAASNATV